jgi:hypothetical protein
MNLKILFGSFICMAVMILVPSIPAIEFHQAETAVQCQVMSDLQQLDMQTLREDLQSASSQPLCIRLVLFIVKMVFRVIGGIVSLIMGGIRLTTAVVCRILSLISTAIHFMITILISIGGLILRTFKSTITFILRLFGTFSRWILNLLLPGKPFART